MESSKYFIPAVSYVLTAMSNKTMMNMHGDDMFNVYDVVHPIPKNP